MLNIIGISIAFIGTVVSVYDVIKSKPNAKGMTWHDVDNLGKKELVGKRYTVVGLSLIGVGFFVQIIAAINAL